MSTVYDAVLELCNDSYEQWNNADESDRRRDSYRQMQAECDGMWQCALDALLADDHAVAVEWLRSAARLEREGGDDTTARRALAIIEAAT